jgi:hypothetical protein
VGGSSHDAAFDISGLTGLSLNVSLGGFDDCELRHSHDGCVHAQRSVNFVEFLVVCMMPTTTYQQFAALWRTGQWVPTTASYLSAAIDQFLEFA